MTGGLEDRRSRPRFKQRTGERVITQIAQSNYHNASTTPRLPRCQKGLLKVSSDLLSIAWLRDARLVVSAIVALSVCFPSPAARTASKPPTAHASLFCHRSAPHSTSYSISTLGSGWLLALFCPKCAKKYAPSTCTAASHTCCATAT